MKPTDKKPDGAEYLLGTDGRIAFTEDGRRFLGPLFAEVGINLADVRTHDQYLEVRRRAGPWFLEHLSRHAWQRLGNNPSLDARAVLAAIGDDEEEYQRLFRQLETRNRLRILDGGIGSGRD